MTHPWDHWLRVAKQFQNLCEWFENNLKEVNRIEGVDISPLRDAVELLNPQNCKSILLREDSRDDLNNLVKYLYVQNTPLEISSASEFLYSKCKLEDSWFGDSINQFDYTYYPKLSKFLVELAQRMQPFCNDLYISTFQHTEIHENGKNIYLSRYNEVQTPPRNSEEYKQRGLQALERAQRHQVQNSEIILICEPTGYGKTGTLPVLEYLHNGKGSVMVSVPTITAQNSSYSVYKEQGIPCAQRGNNYATGERETVRCNNYNGSGIFVRTHLGTVMSMIGQSWSGVQALFIDEVHEYNELTQSMYELALYFEIPRIYLMTATPLGAKGYSTAQYFQNYIHYYPEISPLSNTPKDLFTLEIKAKQIIESHDSTLITVPNMYMAEQFLNRLTDNKYEVIVLSREIVEQRNKMHKNLREMWEKGVPYETGNGWEIEPRAPDNCGCGAVSRLLCDIGYRDYHRIYVRKRKYSLSLIGKEVWSMSMSIFEEIEEIKNRRSEITSEDDRDLMEGDSYKPHFVIIATSICKTGYTPPVECVITICSENTTQINYQKVEEWGRYEKGKKKNMKELMDKIDQLQNLNINETTISSVIQFIGRVARKFDGESHIIGQPRADIDVLTIDQINIVRLIIAAVTGRFSGSESEFNQLRSLLMNHNGIKYLPSLKRRQQQLHRQIGGDDELINTLSGLIKQFELDFELFNLLTTKLGCMPYCNIHNQYCLDYCDEVFEEVVQRTCTRTRRSVQYNVPVLIHDLPKYQCEGITSPIDFQFWTPKNFENETQMESSQKRDYWRDLLVRIKVIMKFKSFLKKPQIKEMCWICPLKEQNKMFGISKSTGYICGQCESHLKKTTWNNSSVYIYLIYGSSEDRIEYKFADSIINKKFLKMDISEILVEFVDSSKIGLSSDFRYLIHNNYFYNNATKTRATKYRLGLQDSVRRYRTLDTEYPQTICVEEITDEYSLEDHTRQIGEQYAAEIYKIFENIVLKAAGLDIFTWLHQYTIINFCQKCEQSPCICAAEISSILKCKENCSQCPEQECMSAHKTITSQVKALKAFKSIIKQNSENLEPQQKQNLQRKINKLQQELPRQQQQKRRTAPLAKTEEELQEQTRKRHYCGPCCDECGIEKWSEGISPSTTSRTITTEIPEQPKKKTSECPEDDLDIGVISTVNAVSEFENIEEESEYSEEASVFQNTDIEDGHIFSVSENPTINTGTGDEHISSFKNTWGNYTPHIRREKERTYKPDYVLQTRWDNDDEEANLKPEFNPILENINVEQKLVCKFCEVEISTTGKLFQHENKCRRNPKNNGLSVKQQQRAQFDHSREFKCRNCNKTFSSLEFLDKHRKNEHPMNVKEYSCFNCDFTSVTHALLYKHIPQCPNKPKKSKEFGIISKSLDRPTNKQRSQGQKQNSFITQARFIQRRKSLLQRFKLSYPNIFETVEMDLEKQGDCFYGVLEQFLNYEELLNSLDEEELEKQEEFFVRHTVSTEWGCMSSHLERMTSGMDGVPHRFLQWLLSQPASMVVNGEINDPIDMMYRNNFNNHIISRNSSSADIEQNPGPIETVQKLEPVPIGFCDACGDLKYEHFQLQRVNQSKYATCRSCLVRSGEWSRKTGKDREEYYQERAYSSEQKYQNWKSIRLSGFNQVTKDVLLNLSETVNENDPEKKKLAKEKLGQAIHQKLSEDEYYQYTYMLLLMPFIVYLDYYRNLIHGGLYITALLFMVFPMVMLGWFAYIFFWYANWVPKPSRQFCHLFKTGTHYAYHGQDISTMSAYFGYLTRLSMVDRRCRGKISLLKRGRYQRKICSSRRKVIFINQKFKCQGKCFNDLLRYFIKHKIPLTKKVGIFYQHTVTVDFNYSHLNHISYYPIVNTADTDYFKSEYIPFMDVVEKYSSQYIFNFDPEFEDTFNNHPMYDAHDGCLFNLNEVKEIFTNPSTSIFKITFKDRGAQYHTILLNKSMTRFFSVHQDNYKKIGMPQYWISSPSSLLLFKQKFNIPLTNNERIPLLEQQIEQMESTNQKLVKDLYAANLKIANLLSYLYDIYQDESQAFITKGVGITPTIKSASYLKPSSDYTVYEFDDYIKVNPVLKLLHLVSYLSGNVNHSFSQEPSDADLQLYRNLSKSIPDDFDPSEIIADIRNIEPDTFSNFQRLMPSFLFVNLPKRLQSTQLIVFWSIYQSFFPNSVNHFELLRTTSFSVHQNLVISDNNKVEFEPVLTQFHGLLTNYHTEADQCAQKCQHNHRSFIDDCFSKYTQNLDFQLEEEWKDPANWLLQCPDCDIIWTLSHSGPTDDKNKLKSHCPNGHKISRGDHLYRQDLKVHRVGNMPGRKSQPEPKVPDSILSRRTQYFTGKNFYNYYNSRITRHQLHTTIEQCNRSCVHCTRNTYNEPYDFPSVKTNQVIRTNIEPNETEIWIDGPNTRSRFIWDGTHYDRHNNNHTIPVNPRQSRWLDLREWLPARKNGSWFQTWQGRDYYLIPRNPHEELPDQPFNQRTYQNLGLIYSTEIPKCLETYSDTVKILKQDPSFKIYLQNDMPKFIFPKEIHRRYQHVGQERLLAENDDWWVAIEEYYPERAILYSKKEIQWNNSPGFSTISSFTGNRSIPGRDHRWIHAGRYNQTVLYIPAFTSKDKLEKWNNSIPVLKYGTLLEDFDHEPTCEHKFVTDGRKFEDKVLCWQCFINEATPIRILKYKFGDDWQRFTDSSWEQIWPYWYQSSSIPPEKFSFYQDRMIKNDKNRLIEHQSTISIGPSLDITLGMTINGYEPNVRFNCKDILTLPFPLYYEDKEYSCLQEISFYLKPRPDLIEIKNWDNSNFNFKSKINKLQIAITKVTSLNNKFIWATNSPYLYDEYIQFRGKITKWGEHFKGDYYLIIFNENDAIQGVTSERGHQQFKLRSSSILFSNKVENNHCFDYDTAIGSIDIMQTILIDYNLKREYIPYLFKLLPYFTEYYVKSVEWCKTHDCLRSYSTTPVYEIARNQDWHLILNEGQITIWSNDCIYNSLKTFPLTTYTSPYITRSCPDHDHRWLHQLEDHYLEIPANNVIIQNKNRKLAELYSNKIIKNLDIIYIQDTDNNQNCTNFDTIIDDAIKVCCKHKTFHKITLPDPIIDTYYEEYKHSSKYMRAYYRWEFTFFSKVLVPLGLTSLVPISSAIEIPSSGIWVNQDFMLKQIEKVQDVYYYFSSDDLVWIVFYLLIILGLMWVLYLSVKVICQSLFMNRNKILRLWVQFLNIKYYLFLFFLFLFSLWFGWPCMVFSVLRCRDFVFWCYMVICESWFLIFLFILCFFFFVRFIFRFQFIYMFIPSMNRDLPLLTVSDLPVWDSNEDLSKIFLVVTCGSHGDYIPVLWLARIAAYLGIRTHLWKAKVADLKELADLKAGRLSCWIPGFLQLKTSHFHGYVTIFQPHSPPQNGAQYSCAPSSRWIYDIIMSSNADWKWYIPCKIAEFLTRLSQADFNVSAMSDGNIPRSADGISPLTYQRNMKTGRIGWLAGSDSDEVIPIAIRNKYEKIMKPYHWTSFSNYDKIYMHGGAGTVQTALMCGCEVVVCDPFLDRMYRSAGKDGLLSLTQDDTKTHSLALYIGFLVYHFGYLRLFWPIQVYSLFLYIIKVRFSYIFVGLFICRLYFFFQVLVSYHLYIIGIMISFPFLIKFITRKTIGIARNWFFGGIWEYPILFILPFNFTFFVIFAFLFNFFEKFINEVRNWYFNQTSVIIRRVKGFPLPFGHMILQDNITGEQFEGSFVDGTTWFDEFHMVFHKYIQINVDKIVIPLPFSPYIIKKWISRHQKGNYSSIFNCHTLIIAKAYDFGIIAPLLITCIFILSFLFVLLPGDIYFWLSKKFNLTIFDTQLDQAAFASGRIQCTNCKKYFATQTKLEKHICVGITPIKCSICGENKEGRHICEPAQHNSEHFKKQQRQRIGKKLEEVKEDSINYFESEENFLAQLATLIFLSMNSNENSYTEDEAIHIAIMTARQFILKGKKLPKAPNNQPLPPSVNSYRILHPRRKWQVQFINMLHIVLKPIWNMVHYFYKWIAARMVMFKTFFLRIWTILCFIGQIAHDFSLALWKDLFAVISFMIDHVFGKSHAKRMKSIWALSGVTKTPFLSWRLKLETEIAMSKVDKQRDFLEDYKDMTDNLIRRAQLEQIDGLNEIKQQMLSPQQRKVGFSKPLLSKAEAEIYNFNDDEYITTEKNENRVQEYLQQHGTKLGGDGIFFSMNHPNRIRTSIDRYAPEYDPLNTDDRILARQIAEGMVKQYPNALANNKLTIPEQVKAYIKTKYAPGSPFINTYKSRQEMFNAGWDKVFIKKTYDDLLNGNYQRQFYHAFVKSQVVDIEKVAIQNKNLRTVVAQDLATYWIDQCIQLERNKRLVWRECGAGMGMVLNQNMQYLFEQLQQKRKNGGSFFIADASEYDSRTSPFIYEVLAQLASLGWQHHENGRNIASVLHSKYESMAKSYIIGITENQFHSISIGIPDDELRNNLLNRHPNRFCSYQQALEGGSEFLKDKIVLIKDAAQLYKFENPLDVEKMRPTVIAAQSGAGKTTFIQGKEASFEDLDDLLTAEEELQLSDMRKIARTTNDWSCVNQYWSRIIPRMDPTKILLIHDPHQLSLEQQQSFNVYVARVPTQQEKSNSEIGRLSLLNQKNPNFLYIEGKNLLDVYEQILPSLQFKLQKAELQIDAPFFTYMTQDPEFKAPNPIYFQRWGSCPNYLNVHRLQNINDLEEKLLNYHNNQEIIVKIHYKNRGMGTGQSATSWDNTWGFKAAMIAGWMRYFNYTMSVDDFFKNNVLFNTGDDSGWATRIRKKQVDVEKLKKCFAYYGIELELEFVQNINEIEYLGKKARSLTTIDSRDLRIWRYGVLQNFNRQARYYQEMNGKPKFPQFAVYQDTSALLLRRTATRYYQASVMHHSYLLAHIQRTIGHLMISAFNPELYRMLALEYKEDILEYAKIMNVTGLKVHLESSQVITTDGQTYKMPLPTIKIDHPQINNKSIKNFRTWYKTEGVPKGLHFIRKIDNDPLSCIKELQSKSSNRQFQTGTQKAFFAFVKQNMPPSYYEVLSIHMKPESRDQIEYANRFWAKLEKKSYNPEYTLRTTTDFLHTYIAEIPRQYYKMTPNLLSLYPEDPFPLKNKYVEKFIWYKHLQFDSNGKIIWEITENNSFMSYINVSPYGAVCDGSTFFQEIQDPEYRQEVLEYPLYVYTNLVCLVTIVYICTYPLERMILKLPWIGPIYRLIMFYLIDIPKLYSIVGLVNWHLTAESDPILSAIMPKDPYIQMKRFSNFIVDQCPPWFGYIFRFDLILVWMIPPILTFIKFINGGLTFRKTAGANQRYDPESWQNPWDSHVYSEGGVIRRFIDQAITTDNDRQELKKYETILSCPTSTGKSTLFLMSLIHHFDSIFRQTNSSFNQIPVIHLLVPRLILQQEFSLPNHVQQTRIKIIKSSTHPPINSKTNKPFDNYTNLLQDPLLPSDLDVTTVDGCNSQGFNGIIVVSTYGHFVQLAKNATGHRKHNLRRNQIIVMDEFHELSGELIASLETLNQSFKPIDSKQSPKMNKNIKFFLSATPITLPFLTMDRIDVPISRRFGLPLIYNRDDTPVNNYMWATEQFPEKSKAAIIMVNSYQEIDDTIAALSYNHIKCQEVSRRTLDNGLDVNAIPTNIVLVCSQVITAGINLKGRTLIVDCGKLIQNIRGRIQTLWSDFNNMLQIEGRVSRFQKDDIVIRPKLAGTGKNPQAFPSGSYFTFNWVSQYFQIPQLIPFNSINTNFNSLQRLENSLNINHIVSYCIGIISNKSDACETYIPFVNTPLIRNSFTIRFSSLTLHSLTKIKYLINFNKYYIGDLRYNLDTYQQTICLFGLTSDLNYQFLCEVYQHLYNQTSNNFILVQSSANIRKLTEDLFGVTPITVLHNFTLNNQLFQIIIVHKNTDIIGSSDMEPYRNEITSLDIKKDKDYFQYKGMEHTIFRNILEENQITKDELDAYALLQFMILNGIREKDLKMKYSVFFKGRFKEHEKMIQDFIVQNNIKQIPYLNAIKPLSLPNLTITKFSNKYITSKLSYTTPFYNPFTKTYNIYNEELFKNGYYRSHQFLIPIEDNWHSQTPGQGIPKIIEINRLKSDLEDLHWTAKSLIAVFKDPLEEMKQTQNIAIKEVFDHWVNTGFITKYSYKSRNWFKRQLLYTINKAHYEQLAKLDYSKND